MKGLEYDFFKAFFGLTENEVKEGIKGVDEWVERWYLNENGLGLYGEMPYVFDALLCYRDYSKKYCQLTINFIKDWRSCQYECEDVELPSILDYGAGLGFTTRSLAEAFPDVPVYYLNLRGKQWDFSEAYLKDVPNIRMIESTRGLEPVGLVCAWEFFEHIKNPIAVLNSILSLKPSVLSISNSFGARAYGHYSSYIIENQIIPRREMGRAFNRAMRSRGYEIHLRTRAFWNQRPTLWERCR